MPKKVIIIIEPDYLQMESTVEKISALFDGEAEIIPMLDVREFFDRASQLGGVSLIITERRIPIMLPAEDLLDKLAQISLAVRDNLANYENNGGDVVVKLTRLNGFIQIPIIVYSTTSDLFQADKFDPGDDDCVMFCKKAVSFQSLTLAIQRFQELGWL